MLVSPDGVLNQVPFAAMPGKKPGSYLIEDQAVVIIPVPQLLPELLDRAEKTTPKEPSLLLIGDVDYEAAPSKPEQLAEARHAGSYERTGALGNWTKLPGTREEVHTIQAAFSRRFSGAGLKVLRGDQATENALRQEGPKHRYLHLATHGFFAPKEIKSALRPPKTRSFRPAICSSINR